MVQITDDEVRRRMEFLERRQGVFGGSDAPAVFGFSNYRDALDVYHQKTRPVTEQVAREDLESASIDVFRGNRNERDAVRIFLDMQGYEGRHESRQIHASGSDLVAVHVDGTVFADASREAPRDQTGVIEAKSPRLGTVQKLVAEGVDPYYTIQIQFNCAVTERPWGALAIFTDHHEAGPVIPIEAAADPEFGQMLVARAEEFMRRHVAERVPPEPDEWDISTPENLERLTDRGGEYEVVDDETAVNQVLAPLVEAYVLQKEAVDDYKSKRADAQDWIEDNLDTDAVLTPNGDKLRIVRTDGRTYFQEDQLRDHRPIDRDKFIRWLRSQDLELVEHRGHGDGEFSGRILTTDEAAEALADRLELDLSRFEREGSPSSHIRIYPNN